MGYNLTDDEIVIHTERAQKGTRKNGHRGLFKGQDGEQLLSGAEITSSGRKRKITSRMQANLGRGGQGNTDDDGGGGVGEDTRYVVVPDICLATHS